MKKITKAEAYASLLRPYRSKREVANFLEMMQSDSHGSDCTFHFCDASAIKVETSCDGTLVSIWDNKKKEYVYVE